MKVDNFEVLEDLLFQHLDEETTAKTDKVVLGRIIRRRKENPGDPRTEFIVKRYTFSTRERFRERKDEIIKLCELFNARFYVAVTIKSMREIAFDMAEAMPTLLRNEQFYYARRMFDNMGDANKGIKEHRLWIYDIDDKSHVNAVIRYMKNAYEKIKKTGQFDEKSLYEKYVVGEIPTINGTHLLVKPHDIRYINDYKTNTIILTHEREVTLSTAIDVKKNAMTLAYYSDGKN